MANVRRQNQTRRNVKQPFVVQIAKSLTYKGNVDIEFIVLILLMLLFGLIMVSSASAGYSLAITGDSMGIAKKQLIGAVVGFIIMLLVSRVDYHIITERGPLTLIIAVSWILMMAAAFTESTKGASRWIFGFQPSEIAKIAWVMFFAKVCSKQTEKELKTFSESWLKYAFMIGLLAIPLILQPHKSALVLMGIVCLTIVIVAGADLKYMFALSPIAIIAVAVILFASEYSRERIISSLDPFKDMEDSGWQAVQSLYAIGSGGFMGKGLGRSIQKGSKIPEPQNDFIFSIICEELGLVGAILVLVLFFMFMIRCIKISLCAPDKLGCLLGIGLGTLIFAQMAINIAVVTATIPVTGMPLPFFSSGVSSLLITLAGMGILLNISRHGRQKVIPKNKK